MSKFGLARWAGQTYPRLEGTTTVDSAQLTSRKARRTPLHPLTPSDRTLFPHGGVLPVGAGGVGCGLDGLSSLNIPGILPKNPFFLLPSWLAAFGPGVAPPAEAPFGEPGGGSDFSPPRPNMREKNP